jgi:tRNA-Thr(GGU) m(6)t(6)A37 methyltransferase TsaA
MRVIAHIETDFQDKFGIPRQSGLVEGLEGKIVFTPAYRNPDALRGIEQFSHLWLLWEFSRAQREEWSPTVRPPRLGGNQRIGVFATRSPFRPNPIGLSCVKLKKVDWQEKEGPVLYVTGVDLLDQTPIYDIKPYIPYADCHPEAAEGYTAYTREHRLTVDFPEELLAIFPEEKRMPVMELLAQDPRPAYITDAGRSYGMRFAGRDVHFKVDGDRLTVYEVTE